MKAGHFITAIVLISTVCSVFEIALSLTYGPSLVSLTRWDRLSRGPTILNPDTGRIISLEDYPNYSVVIPLAPESPTASSNQVFISRRVSGPGMFHIEAPPGYGVMAVVQSLDLRVADDACNDFIMFSDSEGNGGETTGTCGKVDIRDGSHAPQGLIGPRAFVSPSGRMRVLFYHGFIWGLVRNFNFDLLDPSLNPTLRLEVVFTAFKDCPSSNATSVNQPQQENDKDFSVATCTPSAPNSKTCIRKELMCDRSVNCAFDRDFGSDEDITTCQQERLSVGSFKSQHSPPTTTAASTTTKDTTTTTTEATTTTTTRSTSTSTPTTEPSPITTYSRSGRRRNRIETTTERELKNSSSRSTGTDAVGLVGLVRKFPRVEPQFKPGNTISNLNQSINATFNVSNSTLITKNKMPYASGGELFVDIKADPIEHPLTGGVSKEDELSVEDDESMSPNTIAGVFCVVAVVLVLIGLLRVYYCYNKVIWNPHGSLPSPESPPETPNANLMRKMKELAAESEEVFNEKKKGMKEQPPSYEILFPLPEEKVNKNGLNV